MELIDWIWMYVVTSQFRLLLRCPYRFILGGVCRHIVGLCFEWGVCYIYLSICVCVDVSVLALEGEDLDSISCIYFRIWMCICFYAVYL